jgi:hypothetical protein
MSIESNAPQFMLPSGSNADSIAEYGLPTGRGTTISSQGNTGLSTAYTIKSLVGSDCYNGNISASDQQDYYKVDASSGTLNVFVSDLNGNVGIQLLDSSNHLVQDGADGNFASVKALTASVGAGTYYVRIYSLDSKSTDYSVSLTNGKTYYVSTKGSDEDSGSFEAPFQTITQAAKVAKAGETIFVREGTYYERRVSLQNSGTADAPITLASTPGETVVIDHGLRVSSWSAEGGGVYRGTPIYSSADSPENTVRVIVGGQPLLKVSDRGQLKEGTFWVDSSGALEVWASGGVDPGTQETLVLNRPAGDVDGNDQVGIFVEQTANYVVIDGFIDRAADNGVWAYTDYGENQGLVVKNCEIKYSWDNGIRLDHWNGALIENCNIHNTDQVALPRGKFAWPTAIIGSYSRNVTVSGNRVHHNLGEGIDPYRQTSNWDILNNVVHDNWSVNIYIDTDLGDITVKGNYVYDTQDGTEHADGIRIANEMANYLGNDSNVTGIKVENNKIVGTGGGIRFFNYTEQYSSLEDSVISNNTIINTYNDLHAIWVDRGDNVVIENNVASDPVQLDTGLNQGIQVRNNKFTDQALSDARSDSGVTFE